MLCYILSITKLLTIYYLAKEVIFIELKYRGSLCSIEKEGLKKL